jgi:hypothetical protein
LEDGTEGVHEDDGDDVEGEEEVLELIFQNSFGRKNSGLIF